MTDTSSKYDCGVAGYADGFKAWFTYPSSPDRHLVVAWHDDVEKVVYFNNAFDALMAAKNQMLHALHKDIEAWQCRKPVHKKAIAGELIRATFGKNTTIPKKDGGNINVEVRRKRI